VADTERHNEGLYNAPEVVYQQLNRLGLQRLYSSNSSTSNIAATNRAQPLEQPTRSIPAQARVTVMVEQNGTTRQWQIDNPTPELISSLQQQSATNRR
jgi:hypothetical protein